MTFNNNEFFLLFSNCFLVKGPVQSTICDVYLNRYKIIPNLLYDILMELKNSPVNLILKQNEEEKEGILLYISRLLEDEWGHISPNKELFPPIEERWEHPFLLTNAILDYDKESTYNILSAIEKIDKFKVEALQIRLFDSVPFSFIEALYSQVSKTSIEYVALLIPYSDGCEEFINSLHSKFSRIQKVTFHSSPLEKIVEVKNAITYFSTHVFILTPVKDKTCCGVINPEYFNSNIHFYMETLKFNNCLNKKIGVDVTGYIRNCPSSETTFGSIDDTDIYDVVCNNHFTKFWHIKKEEIETCSVCEFRMICPDCRVYIENPSDIFSKPQKCSYDPYTATWN
ncbi:grasp-with-spasm system SPASM domain peptide maturase [Taibaiella chishuiensis]|uniref:SPASM domain peptide maturase of grasp-with-spasm system n=1 Tax=Taibaiella chishuiensis TaxID=1434707 RepID=A0A2P8DAF0_9BACT|nr:grasp-with-spasm system SPASM domain peptide maturase [Taibaiella chishuiensis]PSK94189.1 SPASM domain peptide maturase of grasp-with-spasm system [Taibaiella chishuiensis]